VPIVVAINRFPKDTAEELDAIAAECDRQGAPWARVEAFTRGGAGAVDLAEIVVELIETHPDPAIQPVYSLDDSLEDKVGKVAAHVYGAAGAVFSDKARAKLAQYAEWGYGRLPVCIAKTQYSLTDDPKRMGAPIRWTLQVNDASLSAGAGFVVAIAGNIMLMPGLPSHSRAMDIDVDPDGNIGGI
jgi:formate--tetrahydrofolate ligase